MMGWTTGSSVGSRRNHGGFAKKGKSRRGHLAGRNLFCRLRWTSIAILPIQKVLPHMKSLGVFKTETVLWT